MAEVTVTQLAETTGTSVERLLQQLQEAGLSQKAANDLVSEEEKQTLLAHIKSSHGETEAEAAPKKITLKRRTLSTLKTGGSSGRGRTVNVEVRKKRTYVRKAETDEEELAEEAEAVEANESLEPAVAEAEPVPEVTPESEARAKQQAVMRAAHDELSAVTNRRRDEAAK
jgi:translation initiation factor IF-2